MSVESRITAYLCCGGAFNPELANHDAVRDLIIDCRAELSALRADAQRYRWLRVNSTQPAEGWSTHSNPESFDAAIDAARLTNER